MAYAKRTDQNQREIMDAFRAMGAQVFDLSRVGKGIPDLLVAWRGHTLLVEVKSSEKALYTKDQLTFIAAWQGGPLARINDIEGVKNLLNSMFLITKKFDTVVFIGPNPESFLINKPSSMNSINIIFAVKELYLLRYLQR